MQLVIMKFIKSILSKPRIFQAISTVVAILIVFLCPLGDIQKLIVSFLIVFMLHHIANLLIFIDIAEHGISGVGRLLSCEPRSKILPRDGLIVVFHGYYNPIVLYYLGEKKHEDELWGAFYNQRNTGNDNYKIIFDEKSGRIISADKVSKKTYIIHTIIWCSISMILIVTAILI